MGVFLRKLLSTLFKKKLLKETNKRNFGIARDLADGHYLRVQRSLLMSILRQTPRDTGNSWNGRWWENLSVSACPLLLIVFTNNFIVNNASCMYPQSTFFLCFATVFFCFATVFFLFNYVWFFTFNAIVGFWVLIFQPIISGETVWLQNPWEVIKHGPWANKLYESLYFIKLINSRSIISELLEKYIVITRKLSRAYSSMWY